MNLENAYNKVNRKVLRMYDVVGKPLNEVVEWTVIKMFKEE